ncbi:MAG TPA: DUF4105 domain-containing protein, partial [Dongiaceae bacterium]|nr:DUF4105 domain-containing protein [Dongiaceae bacterium]
MTRAATTSDIAALANDREWLALLHMDHAPLNGQYRSQVDDPDFFLAPSGGHDPQAELEATLAAFLQPADAPDQHAACKFPARFRWLHARLDLPAPALTPQQCPEFQQWLGLIRPHSITLVFASSFLNSPSSMFGHTFLRIDPEDLQTGSDWLSFAVNFGAELHPEDNSILYAYKGLFGGYPGFFSVMRYVEKINEYNRLENRDLWEYHLNLSPAEVQTLIWHLWELRDIDFDYFFFDENCSYRLLELLEVARPSIELTDQFGTHAIPIDTVRVVEAASMINDVSYRSSEASQIQYQADLLTSPQQQLAWELAHQKRPLDDPELRQLDTSTQAQVLRVAYKHLRYLQLGEERDPKQARHSLAILQQLRALHAGEAGAPPTPTAPEQGHDSLLLGVAGGRSDGRNLMDLRIRTSYHDLADNPDGYLDGAAINIGELQLRQREDDSLQVEMLNFVDINSHSPRTRFFDPLTWRVKAGFDRVYAEKESSEAGDFDDTLTARVNGGAGITLPLGDRHLVYGLGMARLEYNKLLDDNLAVGAGALAGALFYL